jgi:hypothetical protein
VTEEGEKFMHAVIQPQPVLPLPRPDCLVWYAGDPCDELIQQYQEAAEQQQWQPVIAPLEKQIVDQQIQIKTLQLKLDSQTAEALQSDARNQAFLDGMGAFVGVSLAFLVAIAGFRRLARSSPNSKHEPQGASPI